jgi:hypothetical protein
MGQLGADNHPTGTRATANIRPPETGRNTLAGRSLAHKWRTMAANRLPMRDRAPRPDMYFI